MPKNHEILDPKRDAEFNHQIAGGLHLGTQALQYLDVRGFHSLASSIAQQNRFSVESKAMAVMGISLPNQIALLRNEPGDISICSAMHAAMGDIIDGSYGTSYTKTAFINGCIRFCNSNMLLKNGEEAKKLEEQIAADVMGVWSEHSWENLLLGAGIYVERSNIGEDLAGTDLWIQTSSDAWVPADIKVRPQTAQRHAHDKHKTIEREFLLDAHDISAQDFSLYVATTNDHRSAYLAFENPPSSGNIAPIDFRDKPQTLTAARNLLTTLDDLLLNGELKAFEMVDGANGVHFIPSKQRAKR